MQLPLGSNAYDDVTYFEICGFHKNTKKSREQNIFSSNKKNINYTSNQRLLYWKK